MRNKFILFFSLLTFQIFSQAPKQISYQAVARNSSGQLIPNQAISVKFDLHQSSAGGAIVFNEIHNATTNGFGLFTLTIGTVNNVGFNTINWANGPYFLEVSMDPTGGASYVSVGNQQLTSVPFALYAEKAGNASPTPTITINTPNTISNPSTGVYSITVPNSSLSINSNSLSISNGNTVVLPSGVTYTAGSGIDLTGNIITNTAPNQTVTVSGTGVSGSYPNYVVNAPTSQTLSISGNTLDISNGNSVVLPAGTTYSAGTGIDIASGVITNTAPAVTLNGSAVAGSFPNYTVNATPAQTLSITGNTVDISNGNSIVLPAGTTYSAGAGIDISGGVITNTAMAVTPTLTVSGNTISINPGNSQALPNYGLTQSGSNIDLTQNGSTIATVTLAPGTSYVAGTGIAVTSGTITNTAPDQTVTLTGTGVSGSYPNFTITPAPAYVGDGTNISVSGSTVSLINTSVPPGLYGGVPYAVPTFSVDVYGRLQSAGNFTPNVAGDINGTISAATVTGIQGRPVANTVPGVSQVLSWNGSAWTPTTTTVSTPTITGIGSATVTSSGNTFTVNTPVPQVYTAGAGISISSGIISNTAPNQVVNITGPVVGGVYPNYTVASQTLSVASNSVLSLSQGGGTVTITPAVLTYTAGTNALRLTDGLSISTVTLNNTPATAITQGTNNNIAVTGTAPNFTVSAPSYSLNVSTNTLTLSNGVTTSTAVMATPLLVYNSNTTSLTSTLSVGTQSITMANWSLNGNGGTTPGTHYLGTSDANDVSFKTSAVERMRLWSTGGLNIGGSTVTAPFASGITLRGAPAASYGQLNINSTSGASANQAYLSFSGGVGGVLKGEIGDLLTTDDDIYVLSHNNLKLGNATFSASPAIIVEGATNRVGIGSTAALTDKVEINYASGPTNTHLHLKQFGGDAFSRIKFSNSVAPTKYWINSVTSDPSDVNSGYNVFYFNGTVGHNLFTVGGDGKVSINPFSTLPNSILDVKGRIRLDSSLTMAAYNIPPANSSVNEGRIYYDRPTNKFKVSENGQPYVNLIDVPSPWNYLGGVISPFNNPTADKVAIGQSTANSLLDVFNGAGSGVTANAVAKFANANSAFSASGVLEVIKTDGFGALIYATNTHSVGDGLSINMSNANNGSNAVQVQQFGLGNAGYFDVNNASSNACAVEGRITNGTPSSVGIRGLNFGTAGNAGAFVLNNSANSQSALSVTNAGQGQGGFFQNTNAASFSSAIYAQSNSRSAALTAINTNSTDAASIGIETHAEEGSAIVGNNTSSSNAAARFTNTGQGMALSVENTSNTDPTAFVLNNGSADGLGIQVSGGKAITATNNSSTSPTIYSNNSGPADGIQAFAAQGRALYVQNSANGSAAIEVNNTGTSHSILAYKGAGTTGGNVANFANNSSSNGADAVMVTNSGGGSAIHAVSAASSTVALWVENGHMKSTGGSVTTGALNVNGFTTPAFAPILINCTDVKGTFSFTTTAGGLANGAFIELEIRFSKAYTIAPVVVASPLVDLQGLNYMVRNITPASFFVRVYKSTNGGVTFPASVPANYTFAFNYMVIE